MNDLKEVPFLQLKVVVYKLWENRWDQEWTLKKKKDRES